ncbi:hypothetical protein [Aliivibrio fischeri]|uniref:hypothetical protein n=1 Tax=Aliivibrio fischeri TaxID=668 RepID=UPI0012DA178E|nr:hypothetical protein [Aliivibrio fischeri]MUL15875.1 hypothetical protein [Aliivibrio fischeri]
MYVYKKNLTDKYYSSEHISYLIWVYSAICAGCFAFFFSLLSASSNIDLFNSRWISCSILLYTIALATGIFSLITLINYKPYPKTLYRVLFLSKLTIIPTVCTWSAIGATFSLIAYFSFFGAFIGLTILLLSMFTLKQIFKLAKFDEDEIEERLQKSEL